LGEAWTDPPSIINIMKTYIRPLIIVLVILLAAALVAGWYNYSSAKVTPDYEGLAKHLTSQDVKMYGAFWCHICIKQEKLFGDAFQYITYIESSTPDGRGQTDAAKEANITQYPTWVFPDGSRVVGLMTYEQLSKKSNYSPPS